MIENGIKNNDGSFANLLKQEEDFKILNELDDKEVDTLIIAYDEAINHSTIHRHN